LAKEKNSDKKISPEKVISSLKRKNKLLLNEIALLNKNEERFKHLFERTPIGYQSLDENGNFLEVNNAWCEMLGYERDEMIGKWFGDVLESSFVDKFRQNFPIFKKAGEIRNIEFEMVKKTGEHIIVSFNGKIGYDEKGNFKQTHCVLSDITESKKIHELILMEKDFSETVLNSLPGVFYVISRDGGFIRFNQNFLKVTGYTQEEFRIINVLDLFEGPDRILIEERINDVYAKGFSYAEANLTTKKGEKIPYYFTGKKFEFNGEPCLIGMGIDITKRKQAEEELRKSGEHYRVLIETMNDGMVQVDIDDRIIFVNNSLCRMLGYESEELTGKISMNKIVHKDDIEKVLDKNILRIKGVSDSYHIRGVKKNGDIIWFRVSGSPLQDNKGNVTGSVGIFTDINKRKEAEDALKGSERQFRTTLENVNLIAVMLDIRGRITFCNDYMLNLTGWKREDVIGKDWFNAFLPEDISDKVRVVFNNSIMTGNIPLHYDNEIVTKNGVRRMIQWNNTVLYGQHGEVTSVVSIGEDITGKLQIIAELVEAKEKAEEASKIKSNFLSNMSHEIRTPMVAILGYTDLLRDMIENKEHKEFVEMIHIGGERLLTTLNLVLDMSMLESNKLRIEIVTVDLVREINNTIKFFGITAKKKNLYINFETKYDSLKLNLDIRILKQVLNNLIINAIKYTHKGGITITLNKETKENKNYIAIRVKDTGIGIPEDKQNIIWEEFRQVSEGLSRKFEGTGLGLSITRKFAEKLDSIVYLEQSEAGVGSTFTLLLPGTEAEMKITKLNTETAVPPVSKSADSKLPDVLYIEDDFSAIYVVKRLLKGIYNIEAVLDARTGIESAGKKQYDAVLIDINLGTDMNGMEAAAIIKKINGYEKTPLVALTAFAMPGDREEFLQNGLSHYLSKPFSKAELLNLMTEVMGSKG